MIVVREYKSFNTGCIIIFMLLATIILTLSVALDGICLLNDYPSGIPSGYSRQKTKYRVIEWDNGRSQFCISDADKISVKSDTVIIYPPIYVQEWLPLMYGRRWHNYTLQKKYETVFVMDNVSVVRTDGSKVTAPKGAEPATTPFDNFRATLIAADKLVSQRMFVDVFKSKTKGNEGILKIMTTDHFKSQSRADKIGIMQSSWKLWSSICASSCGNELMLAFVDRKNNLLGYAKGEEISSIVLP